MPVIITEENEELWLSYKGEDREILQSLLKPYKSNQLIIYPVSRAVNRADYDSPECIEPGKNGVIIP